MKLISQRDVLQVDFLFDVYEDVVKDEPLSFLEVGCGPAQHSMEMAESQLDVYCVDKSLEMLDYAAALAAEDDIEMTRVHADMRNFSLPVRSSLTSLSIRARPTCLENFVGSMPDHKCRVEFE
jgi:SAM-dependent methyltransferase